MKDKDENLWFSNLFTGFQLLVLLLVFKSLNNSGPKHISDILEE